jgi:hypothetical protein
LRSEFYTLYFWQFLRLIGCNCTDPIKKAEEARKAAEEAANRADAMRKR